MNIKLLLIAVGLVLFVMLFYWFEMRPSKIKSDCMERYKIICSRSEANCTSDGILKAYQVCLHEKGL